MKYRVRVYEASALGFLTQADHYEDYDFETDESLRKLAMRLNREGFPTDDGEKWIMPAAILTVEKC